MGGLLQRSLSRHVDGFSAGGGVESLPPFDYHLPLMSLPFVLRIREATIPKPVPYLLPDPLQAEAWRTRPGQGPQLKVGLAWMGSPDHQRNRFRLVGLERFVESFRGIEKVAFYSLQPGAETAVAAARAAGLAVEDYTEEFHTFDETAAFVSALDPCGDSRYVCRSSERGVGCAYLGASGRESGLAVAAYPAG